MRKLFVCLSLSTMSCMYGMEHLSEPIQEGVSDLLAVCATADLEMVKQSVEYGVSVNCKNKYGLHLFMLLLHVV